MDNCKKCRCPLTSYTPFNSIEPEIFCECCEGDDECPNPKEKTMEDYPNWDSFGSFSPVQRSVITKVCRSLENPRVMVPIPPPPTSPNIAPPGKSRHELLGELTRRYHQGIITHEQFLHRYAALPPT